MITFSQDSNSTKHALNQHIVDAITRDDWATLQPLVQTLGIDGSVTYKYQAFDGNWGTVTHTLSGTALNIAAYLRKQNVAIELLRAGADVFSACYTLDFGGGWDEQSVALVETITTRRLPDLMRELMQSRVIDWNDQNWYDHDDLSARRYNATLFSVVLGSKDTAKFFQRVGIFAGLVLDHQIKIERAGKSFDIYIDGSLSGQAGSMREALHKVAMSINYWARFETYESLIPFRDDEPDHDDYQYESDAESDADNEPKNLAEAILDDCPLFEQHLTNDPVQPHLTHDYEFPHGHSQSLAHFVGSPACFAALLKRESMAITLLGYCGTEQDLVGHFSYVPPHACEEYTMTLLELALQSGMVDLFRETMQRFPEFNWSHRNWRLYEPTEDAGTPEPGRRLFSTLFHQGAVRADDALFLQQAGIICGRLEGHAFRVERHPHGTFATVDGKSGPACATMAEALMQVKDILGFVPDPEAVEVEDEPLWTLEAALGDF